MDCPAFEPLEPRLLLDAVKDPYLQSVMTDSMYVLQEADDQTAAVVEYGLTSGYGSQASTESTELTRADRGFYTHNIKLTGLQPNTQYHYRVTHGATTSADKTFWTAAEPGTSFRFGFMADSRTNKQVHGDMAALMDTFDPRMIVFGGDTNAEATWNSWDKEFFLAEQEALNAEVPFANAVGNHEGWNALTRAYTQGPTAEGESNGYYSFDYGDAHFLILNTEINHSQGSAQWNFAADDLANTTQTWKFVAYHKPAYTSGGHAPDAAMQAMSTALFEPNGVDMTLTGHNHYYQHNLVNGIHHMVIGTTGAPLKDLGTASYIVYTEKTYNLGVFDMTPTTLDMTAYRRDGTVIETIHLVKDSTPPSTPADLSATAVSDSQIDLSWSPASDPESGISYYNIYRDSQLIDTTDLTTYSDTGLSELTAYTYEVSAVNGDMLEGDKSAPVGETTPADAIAPTLDSVSAANDTLVTVVYSEPVDETSAETLANYGIDQGITISAAVLQADTKTVELTVSTLTEDVTYSLTVNNVQDRAATPNTIAPDTQANFIHMSWQGTDIGAVGVPGSDSEVGGVWTVDGSGADIWGNADEFHYVYQSFSGNAEIIVRVASVENTNVWAKAGVMIRETLADNSKHAFIAVTPGSGVSFQRRTTTGGASDHTTTGGFAAPYWVKLVRSGDTFTGYRSPNGTDWTQQGSVAISMATDVYIGMALTSHNDATLCTAEFDNVTITEFGENFPPTAADDAYSVDEDGSLVVDTATGVLVNDTDPEEDPLTAILVSDVSNGTLNLSSDGSFSYTPDPDFFGGDSFTYKANDGYGDSGNATVTLTVNGLPDAPVAVNDAYDALADTTLIVDAANGALANDSDADNDPLTAELVSDVSNGTLNLNTDGSFDYTPNPGYIGPDSFTYKAFDGGLYSNVATADITVTSYPPTAVDDAYSMDEDGSLVVDAPTGVLVNDTDPEEDPLTAILVSGVSNGTLNLGSDGSFDYTPDPDFFGADSFTYKANDGYGDSNDATVTLTVNALPDAPVAVNDAYDASQDTTLIVDAANGVLANDSDADNDPLTAELVSDVSNGTLNLNTDGSFDYTPNPGYTGPDSFTYQAFDGGLYSSVATVDITVEYIPMPPTAVDDAYSVDEDGSLVVDAATGVLANDTDPEGDPLTAILVGGDMPAGLVIQLDASAIIGLTNGDPVAVWGDATQGNASDQPTYVAGDADINNMPTVSFDGTNDKMVYPTADARTVFFVTSVDSSAVGLDGILGYYDRDDGIRRQGDTGWQHPGDGNDFTNPGGSTFRVNGVSTSDAPENVWHIAEAVRGGGTWEFNQIGQYYGDRYYPGDIAEVLIFNTVLTADEMNNVGGYLAEKYGIDTEYTGSLVSGVSNGTLNLNSDGSFDYTPDPDFFGTDSFTYKAFDGGLYSNDATVTITVNGLPDAPVAVNDAYDAEQDTTLNVDAAGGVLANDSDADNDPITAELVGDVSNGTLNLNANGSFDYTPNPGYSGPDSFTYQAFDGGLYSNVATADITVAGVSEFYAGSETTTTGTVVGSYLDTQASDNVYEQLTEALGGKKSILEHTWTFDITGGTSVSFSVEAWHDGTEDDFVFQYSTDGSIWTDMVTITKTSDDDTEQTYDLPSSLSGTVYVRVIDTNRRGNKMVLDTLYVDEMFILVN